MKYRILKRLQTAGFKGEEEIEYRKHGGHGKAYGTMNTGRIFEPTALDLYRWLGTMEVNDKFIKPNTTSKEALALELLERLEDNE